MFSECPEPASIERDYVFPASFRCAAHCTAYVRVSTGGVHPVQRYCGLGAGLVNRYARAVSPIASARTAKTLRLQQVAGLRVWDA